MDDGVWRTIRGRRVFIKKGQSLDDAMNESGKFNTDNNTHLNKYRDKIDSMEFQDLDNLDYKKMYEDYENWYNTLDKDEVKKVVEKWQEHVTQSEDADIEKQSNPIGEYINKQLGYDGKPELIDEKDFFDKINFKGKEIIDYDTTLLDENHWYRGLSGDKAKGYIEEFKNGKFFAGEGYGVNGTYFTSSHSEAMCYADQNEKNIIYAMPKDTAKIATREKISYIGKTMMEQMDWNKYMSEEGEIYTNFTDVVLGDNGYTASLLGYDIIKFSTDDRKVVLNRSSIKVVK